MQDSPAETVCAQAPVELALADARLSVAGPLLRPCSHSIRSLRRLPRHELGPVQVNCFTGRPVASVLSYAGARLIDLLDDAGLSSTPRSRLKRCVILAGSQDGYQAIFSWNELYNSPIGAGVLVLYERDGQALDTHLGELSLISAHDTQLGPRHLRLLSSIRSASFELRSA